MPKVSSLDLLNKALDEVYALNEQILLKLDQNDAGFQEHQPATFGKAELIKIAEDHLELAGTEDEQNSCLKQIVKTARELDTNLDKFAKAYPQAKIKCELAKGHLANFLKANLGAFPGKVDEDKRVLSPKARVTSPKGVPSTSNKQSKLT